MNRKPIKACIVSPSESGDILSKETIEIATKNLKELNINIAYSKNFKHKQSPISTLIQNKADDINNAYLDSNIDLILSSIGGYNSNRILELLDWEAISSNPKPICGYSDITVLLNAIHAITGQTTYLGPHLSTFGMKKGLEYSLKYFELAVLNNEEYTLNASPKWSDDSWFLDQENRKFIKNEGPIIVNEGASLGKILGGNLCSLNLLQGTKFMPNLNGSILFLEDDALPKALTLKEFERNLHSLLNQTSSCKIAGLLIGRFQIESKVNTQDLIELLNSYEQLKNCPIVCNMDFGHTTPMFTVPIGGNCHLSTTNAEVKIRINKPN